MPTKIYHFPDLSWYGTLTSKNIIAFANFERFKLSFLFAFVFFNCKMCDAWRNFCEINDYGIICALCTSLTARLPTLPCNLKPFLTQVNSTSNCNYDYEMLYFDQMIEYTRQNICPETAKSEVGSHQSIRIVCLIFCWFHIIKLSILYLLL